MKFDELKKKIKEYLHIEDDGMIRIALASIIATRLKLGDPVWLILIGPSSGGKSQILRPLALTDEKFIHRVDDMTENTLLSGTRVKKGAKEISLLKRIGALGIIVISDLTVIFSKNSEIKNSILGQLRMVYDGEMIKYSGMKEEPVQWKGSLGILAGSTPSIYAHFEEVADMGERFIYYRMKDYDIETATRRSLDRKMYGKELDRKLADLYTDYIKEVVLSLKENEIVPQINEVVHERILRISMLAALLRAPTHYDRFSKTIDKVPVPEMPMRVALQLSAIARGLMIMKYFDSGCKNWDLDEEDITHIEWCAYSLANEERRACLRVLASEDYMVMLQTQTIADKIGLATVIAGVNLQHLTAIGIIDRSGGSSGLSWSFKNEENWKIIRRLEGINVSHGTKSEREISGEEKEEFEEKMKKDYLDFDSNLPVNLKKPL